MHDLTARHLRLCATRWPDLHDALASTGTTSWPPAGRMSDYLSALDQADAELAEAAAWQAAYNRAFLDRDPRQIGATRPPLRMTVLAAMLEVEQLLLATADQIAAAVQRPVMTPPPATWPEADRVRRELLVIQDRADPRRWRRPGTRPSAPLAAVWLLGRVQGAPGPFRTLTGPENRFIASTAATAAGRIGEALDISTRTATVARPCPHCSGSIRMQSGAGTQPYARCSDCGHVWTSAAVA